MNSDIFEARHGLRRQMLERRKSLSETEWQARSAQIFQRLETYSAIQHARVVHCYISSSARREVDTEPLLTWLLSAGKTIFVPAVRGRSLHLARFQHLDALQAAPFGLREPQHANIIDIAADDFPTIDIVLTPLLACDRYGNRLGYGKGFYDRFFVQLAERGQSPLKIGLAFSFQVIDHVPQFPLDQHRDVPLDMVVTEDSIFQTDILSAS